MNTRQLVLQNIYIFRNDIGEKAMLIFRLSIYAFYNYKIYRSKTTSNSQYSVKSKIAK